MSNQATEWAAEAIVSALDAKKRTKRWLSDQTGIPYPTLNRKLAGKSDLSLGELLTVAEALGVAPATFTPPAFRVERAA